MNRKRKARLVKRTETNGDGCSSAIRALSLDKIASNEHSSVNKQGEVSKKTRNILEKGGRKKKKNQKQTLG